jgi:7-cyano-7-deazaguanine synthase
MAMAVAYAERWQYDAIATGINQEESGAYPDNEQEWLNKWRALMPYAVKANCEISLLDPFGGFMKKDIVRIGAKFGMPFELTWSCYHDGEVHCGNCGPCSMRRRAFQMVDVPDPTEYAQEVLM